jgi:hypothetical protein
MCVSKAFSPFLEQFTEFDYLAIDHDETSDPFQNPSDVFLVSRVEGVDPGWCVAVFIHTARLLIEGLPNRVALTEGDNPSRKRVGVPITLKITGGLGVLRLWN